MKIPPEVFKVSSEQKERYRNWMLTHPDRFKKIKEVCAKPMGDGLDKLTDEQMCAVKRELGTKREAQEESWL
jgi:hypothetical protein